jgi:demethylmenaquinone methyltransferase/2-methoxy-6-polyprenyl-1,4-benzoquinol methylase
MQVVVKPESEAKIAAMFDSIAGKYDFLNRLLSGRQDQRWRKRLISRIPKRIGGSILDVATGTGDVLLQALEARAEYKHFEGVDISEGMLALARKKAALRRDAQGVIFRSMSAENLRYPDHSFDCVTIAFGLRNVVAKDLALHEFKRILKPGGRLLILEFFIPQTGLLGRLFQFYFHQILPRIGGLFSSRDAYTYLPQSVGSFYSPQELAKKLVEHELKPAGQISWLFGAVRLVEAHSN